MLVNVLLILLGVLALALFQFVFLYISAIVIVWRENRQAERYFEEVFKEWKN